MNHKILLLNAGYSLHSLIRTSPNVSEQFALIGLDFGDEVMITDQKQLIAQISRSVKENQLIILVDNAPQLRVREILAQGFNKPLHQDAKAMQDIENCFSRMGRTADPSLAGSAMIPQDAVALSDPNCPQAGFMMSFPSTCVVYLQGSAQTVLRLCANQLFPLLLKRFYPGAVIVDVPIKSESTQEVREYIGGMKRRANGFLPMLGGTSAAPLLRLIAIKENEKLSRQCCDSFLEDLVSECGRVSTVFGVGTKGGAQ